MLDDIHNNSSKSISKELKIGTAENISRFGVKLYFFYRKNRLLVFRCGDITKNTNFGLFRFNGKSCKDNGSNPLRVPNFYVYRLILNYE